MKINGKLYTEQVLAHLPTVQVRYRRGSKDLCVNQFTGMSLSEARNKAMLYLEYLSYEGSFNHFQCIVGRGQLQGWNVVTQERVDNIPLDENAKIVLEINQDFMELEL